MPDIVYTVKLDTASAQTQAAQLRALFQAQLANIQIPLLDPSALSAAVSSTQALTAQYQQMAQFAQQTAQSMQQAATVQPPGPIGGGVGGGSGIGPLAETGLDISALKEIYSTLKDIGTEVVAFSQLNFDARRASEGFTLLSGSAANAQAKLAAMTSASDGALSNLQAMQLANVAASRGIANTAASMEQMTRVASIASRVMGTDIVSAFNAMENAAARQSTRGIAQLGLPIDEVKAKYKELLASGQDLSKEQAFLMAELEVGDSTFSKLHDSALTAASGAEKLAASWSNLVNTIASGALGNAAETEISRLANAIAYASGQLNKEQLAIRDIDNQITDMGNLNPPKTTFLLSLKRAIEEVNKAAASGVPGAKAYLDQLLNMERATQGVSTVSVDQQSALAQLEAGFLKAAQGAKELAAAQDQVSAATAKATALQEAGGQFSALSNSLNELNRGALDALPGVSNLRAELTKFYDILASGIPLTDAQAATFADLNAQADALGGSTSALAGIQEALGFKFLESHDYAAALVEQVANLEALYGAGQIGAAQFAGGMATLTQELYNQLAAAGALTPKLRELLALLGAVASASGGALQGPTASGAPIGGFFGGFGGTSSPGYISGQQQALAAEAAARSKAAATERSKIRADAAAAEKKAAAEALAAQKHAASQAGSAFNQAASETEKAFQKVADNLAKSLEKVDGLLSNSKVTAEDMAAAKAGTYTDKADELRRQLDDFAEHGVSHGIDLQKIKDALNKVGVKASDNLKTLAQQFDAAWNDSSLFANKDNLKLINADAVKASINLKANADAGRKNILEYFGATIDAVKEKFKAGDPSIVEAVGAELGTSNDKNLRLMADQLKAGGQKIIDKVLAMAQASIDKTVGSIGGGGGGGGGSITVPTVTVGTPTGAAGNFLAGGGPLGAFAAGVASGPYTVTSVDMSGITVPDVPAKVRITGLVDDTAEIATLAGSIVKALGDQLLPLTAQMKLLGSGIASMVESGFTAHTYGDMAGAFNKALSTQFGASGSHGEDSKLTVLKNYGMTFANQIEAGFTSHVYGDLAGAFLTAVNTQFTAQENLFYASGLIPAQYVEQGFESYGYGDLASAFLTALNTQFSTQGNLFYASGFVPAQNLERGFTSYGYGDLVGSFLTAISTQFSAKGGKGEASQLDVLKNYGMTFAGQIEAGFGSRKNHIDMAGPFIETLGSQFGSASALAQYSSIGSNIAGLIEGGISSDQARQQLFSAGAALSGAIFKGFESSLQYSNWIGAIVAVVVAQAAASLNTSLQDSLKTQAVGL